MDGAREIRKPAQPSERLSRAAYWRAIVCALLGIATGFSVFLMLTDRAEDSSIVFWGGGLLVASAVAYAIDWLKDTVRGEDEAPRNRWLGVLIALLLVVAFELFTSAIGEVAQGFGGEKLQQIAAQMAGKNGWNAAFRSDDPNLPALLAAFDAALPPRPPPAPEDLTPLTGIDPGAFLATRTFGSGALDALNRRLPDLTPTSPPLATEKPPEPASTASGPSPTSEEMTAVAATDMRRAVIGRVVALMPPIDRLILFPQTIHGDDQAAVMRAIADLAASLGPRISAFALANGGALPTDRAPAAGRPVISGFLGRPIRKYTMISPTWLDACAPDPSTGQAASFDACENATLVAATPDLQRPAFQEALNAVLARHDLYQTDVFGTPAAAAAQDVQPRIPAGRRTAASVFQRAEEQSRTCGTIRAAAGADADDKTCVEILRAHQDVAAVGTRILPVAAMMALNRDLLSYFIAPMVPLPVDWWEIGLLGLVWTAAAVALSMRLTAFALTVPRRTSSAGRGPGSAASLRETVVAGGQALAIAVVIMGLVVIALRLIGFLADLALHTPAQACWPQYGGGLARLGFILASAVPNLVILLHSGGLFGWMLPGVISLPLLILGAMAIGAIVANGSTSGWVTFFGWLPLVGILVISVTPVLGGVISVLFLMAVTWLVPTFGIAAMTPYLEPTKVLPSSLRVAVAAVVVFILLVWTVFRLGQHDSLGSLVLLIAAAATLIADFQLFGRVPVRDAWPLYALTVAFIAIGLAGIVNATFLGVLGSLHAVAAVQNSTQSIAEFCGSTARGLSIPDVPSFAAEQNVRESMNLELALVGALGFWLTLSLVATWTLRTAEEKEAAGSENAPQPAEHP